MNTKSKNYKKYLKLLKELEKNHDAQRNLGYKPLDKPVHHGYDAFFILRDDVSRRHDAYIFQYIIDRFSKPVWSRRKDLMIYSYFEKCYIKNNPTINDISEEVYEKLPLNIKKYFYGYDKQFWNTVRKIYKCTVPDYFFTVKVVKSYKTHYKVIDSVLKQEESYLSDKLYSECYDLWSYHGTVPKRFTQLCNRRDRRKSKIEIRKTMHNNEWDEMELPGRHRHYATWYYW